MVFFIEEKTLKEDLLKVIKKHTAGSKTVLLDVSDLRSILKVVRGIETEILDEILESVTTEDEEPDDD